MGEWGSPPERRATQIEVGKREAEALEMLLDGHSRRSVISHLSTTYGITERTAEGYYTRAKARGCEELGETLRALSLQSARRRERIYQRAMLKDDLATALRAEESLFKLLGVECLPMPIEASARAGEGQRDSDIAKDVLAQMDVRMLAPQTMLRLLSGLERAAPILAQCRTFSEEEIALIRANATPDEIQELKAGNAELAMRILERVRGGYSSHQGRD